MNKLCTVFDFTFPAKKDSMQIMDSLNTFAKAWTFQKEKGSQGYLHYQGRIKLKVRKRFSTMKIYRPEGFDGVHWSVTSGTNKNNTFYVLKEDTRVEGPWSDAETQEENYIPRQILNIILYPFQKTIFESCQNWEPRIINYVYQKLGCVGKSILCQYMDVHKYGVMVPPINDYKDVIQYCMCRRRTKCYLIDMPRALKKEKLAQFYSALETIKSGFLFDLRYKGKVKHIDRPVMWIFGNSLPDLNWLSQDMWKFWEIKNKELIPYKSENGDNYPFVT